MRAQKWFGLLGSLALCAGLVVACGSDEEEDPYPSTDALCDAKAAAECKVAPLCGVGDAGCKADRIVACKAEAAQATGEGRAYTSGFAPGCLEKVGAVYGQSAIRPADLTEVEAVCARVFQGSKKKNESCRTTGECTGSLFCDTINGGVCADRIEKKQGEGCANPGETCEASSFCNTTKKPQVCTPRSGKGDACSKSIPCQADLRCAGTCVDKLGSGESCAPGSDDCAAAAPYCEPSTSKCVGAVFFPASARCKDFGG